MVDRGAKADDKQQAAIVAYLVSNFGKGAKVNMNTAPYSELMVVLGFSADESKALVAYRSEHGGLEGLERTRQSFRPGRPEVGSAEGKDGVLIAYFDAGRGPRPASCSPHNRGQFNKACAGSVAADVGVARDRLAVAWIVALGHHHRLQVRRIPVSMTVCICCSLPSWPAGMVIVVRVPSAFTPSIVLLPSDSVFMLGRCRHPAVRRADARSVRADRRRPSSIWSRSSPPD